MTFSPLARLFRYEEGHYNYIGPRVPGASVAGRSGAEFVRALSLLLDHEVARGRCAAVHCINAPERASHIGYDSPRIIIPPILQ